MLDYFGIFTRGGALLWTLQFTALRHSPLEALNALIRTCLLEERSGDNTFTYVPKTGAHQALKWTFHNGLGLVFVAVYQKSLSLLYVDELLERVKAEFAVQHAPNCYNYKQFDDTFQRMLRECEAKAEASRRPAQIRSSPATAAKSGKTANGHVTSSAAKEFKNEDEDGAAGKGMEDASPDSGSDNSAQEGGAHEDGDGKAFDVSKLKAGPHGVRGGPRGSRAVASTNKSSKDSRKKEDAPKKKVMRNWGVMKNEDPSKLDYSTNDGATSESDFTAGASDSDAAAGGQRLQYVPAGISRMDVEEEFDETEELLEEDDELLNNIAAGKAGSKGASSEPKKRSLLGSFMSSLAMNVVGKQSLSAEDIAPALADMKRKLMERNVAEGIAQNVCDSVGRSLEGQKLSSFTGISAFVKRAFEDALSGILNKRQVDVLLDIKKAQARGKPYVIVFCGVNGVGKSTNLAKIAYWLGQHNIKVMIAACDTFRAGAVEQLKTHCARLQVPLYERGYEKDPAKVAAEAVKQAERDGIHVVLVDTAGRMQDNEPLMRALSNLININEPNLVLFVGEALVGNDAVDQLTKFNRALYDLAPATSKNRHVIDGIVLTKFDTIDDKVGAAVSMVYSSGAPVMFVGCGQTYVDLKKLNVKTVVNSLLK